MFGWFSKKEAEPVVFPDNQAAFDYACAHLDNRILLEAVVPALVLEQGKTGSEGERYFLLHLAGRDGGRRLYACTLKEAVAFPDVGDLVGFQVVRYDPDLAKGLDLLGFISCGFDNVFIPGRGWLITRNYTPANIRPTVRW